MRGDLLTKESLGLAPRADPRSEPRDRPGREPGPAALEEERDRIGLEDLRRERLKSRSPRGVATPSTTESITSSAIAPP